MFSRGRVPTVPVLRKFQDLLPDLPNSRDGNWYPLGRAGGLGGLQGPPPGGCSSRFEPNAVRVYRARAADARDENLDVSGFDPSMFFICKGVN